MLLALAEEVIPALDEPALVLVVDHLQLIAQPVLANLPTQVETAHVNTGYRAANLPTQVETAHANTGYRAANPFTQVETAHANTGLRAANPFTQVETAHANTGYRAAAHHIQHVG